MRKTVLALPETEFIFAWTIRASKQTQRFRADLPRSALICWNNAAREQVCQQGLDVTRFE